MKSYLLFLICWCTSLFSAGPILHLWVAQRFCELSHIEDEAILQGIIIGAEFPDIRYITRQSRDLTHLPLSDLKEIHQSDTSFQIGMKLHAWLDIAREDFIPKEVYDAIDPHAKGFSATLLKLIEEELLADFYDGRQWSPFFDNVLPEQLAFADKETILNWHKMIQWTLFVRPSWLLWGQSYKGPMFGISTDILYDWSYLLPKFKQNPLFQQYMQALLIHIETELQKLST